MTPQTLGNLFSGASALLFFWLCMILPLVGRAARLTDHYWTNFGTFFAFLAAALVCAFLGRRSKLAQFRQGEGTYPWISTVLLWIYVAMMLLLLTGRFNE